MFNDFFEAEDNQYAEEIFNRLNQISDQWERTAVQETRDYNDPFRTLIASMLSARTREEDTRIATNNLFERAKTPAEMVQLSDTEIAVCIQMVTYHESKVNYIRRTCETLVNEHDGNVPQDLESLEALHGIGWKTAVLTQWIAFGIAEEICVDVHVRRIGKRLGLVQPKTEKPQQVSVELMQRVPKHLWGAWNPLMVRFGKEICYFNTPACKACPLNDICPKIGV